MKELLKKIGNFFAGLFKQTEKIFDKLAPDVQKAITTASAFIEIINTSKGAPATMILEKLNENYPDLIGDKTNEALYAAADALNLGLTTKDPVQVIGAIEAYLNKQEGSKWAQLSSMAAKVIAAFFAPDVKTAVIEAVMNTVFHKLVKGKV